MSKLAEAIGANIGRIFAFLCSGFAAILILYVNDKEEVAEVAKLSLGLSMVLALIIGAVVFNLYYSILGELILFPAQHYIHHMFDRCLGNIDDQQTSPIYLLKFYGVKRSRVREAYGVVKSHIFKEDKIHTQLAHAQLHAIYITALSFITEAAVLIYKGSPKFYWYFLLALITLVAAFVSDTIQHAKEGHYIQTYKSDVIDVLKERRFIKASL